MPQIVSTPHIGAATEEAQPRIARHVANTARLFNLYGTVRDTVYAPGQMIGVDGAEPPSILAVVHSDARGTKKSVADAIFEAGFSNLESSHRDFAKYNFAYDLNAVDQTMNQTQIESMIESARKISGDPRAIRSVRVIPR